MSSDQYVSGSDIKNYIYCPRIVYFNKVMDIEPFLTSNQLKARIKHKNEEHNIDRRISIDGIKADKITYDLYLESNTLKASASIDCVIEYRNLMIPVEFKYMYSKKGKAYTDHKYQLAFYAIVIEDVTKKSVDFGYIKYILDKKLVKVIITQDMKNYVKNLIDKIRKDIDNEKLPPINVNKKKCMGGCGYRYVCYGY